MTSEYEKDVFAWGSDDPWLGRKPLKHRTEFSSDEVVTDGRGNVISMPILEDKPCFGRPEVFVRQYGRKKMIKRGTREVEVHGSRCGSCKIGPACEKISTERINSDPQIREAFRRWSDHCRAAHGGKRVYSGPIQGRMWERFKRTIADHGPWSSSNEGKLRELAETKKREERDRWRVNKIRERAQDRAERKAEHEPPAREFIENAAEERNRRAAILEQQAGKPCTHRSISRIMPKDAAATAALTADVWLANLILRSMGYKPGPGRIASQLGKWNRTGGNSYAVLKARIAADLRRIEDLEAGSKPLWSPFNPDSDLPTEPTEIDLIMAEIADRW